MSELMALLGKEDSDTLEIEIKKEMVENIESTDLEQMITQGKQFYVDNLLKSVLFGTIPDHKTSKFFHFINAYARNVVPIFICISCSNLSRILNESAFGKNLWQF